MTDRYFFGTPGEKREETKRLKEVLKSVPLALKDRLESEGSSSVAILPSLPLKVEGGTVRGLLSLKHCARGDAGLGTIGGNTLPINPEFGNWLALAAVITEREIKASPPPLSPPECTRCNQCVEACPAGAIHEGFVTIMACRNLMDYIPCPLLFPLVRHTLQRKKSARITTAFLNRFGSLVGNQVTCTACITACPYFHKQRR
ncbi:MAG: 4Fe-4S binding protein [Methanoregula sp.]|jgi:epoxyqueuosine reductase QueG|uniref:4Fe-4S binding protein n=1 Tax=Methanoregula sp. TaxID=2052170 RepID=UPI003D0F7243